MTNVNNLNGIPNFGHGLPEDGEVVAGVTDIAQEIANIPIEESQEVEESPRKKRSKLAED